MIAIVDKRRSKPGESEAMHVIGNVKDKHAILVDDMVDPEEHYVMRLIYLEKGALSVRAYITHGVLTGKMRKRIQDSKLDEVIITDSITYRCPEDILQRLGKFQLIN